MGSFHYISHLTPSQVDADVSNIGVAWKNLSDL